jgi:hypothetical protein
MGVSERDELRCKVGAAVSYLRATEPEAFGVPPIDRRGREVLVPVLGTDTVLAVTDIVRRMGSSALVVAYMHDDRGIGFGSVRMALTEEHETGDSSSHVPVGPTCTMGDMFRMFVPGTSITIRMDGDQLQLDEVGEVDGKHAASLLDA